MAPTRALLPLACAIVLAAGAVRASTAGPGEPADAALPTCDARCNESLSYPEGEGGARATGKPVLLVCFSPEGGVVEASAHQPSGHPELDEAARRFALGWRAPSAAAEATPRRRCRFFQESFAPPASGAADPRGQLAVAWGPEMDDAVAVHEAYRCDEACRQASQPPVDRHGRRLAGRAAFQVCFGGDGKVEKVKRVESSGSDEVVEAARRHFSHLSTDAVPAGTIVPKRCPVLEIRYTAE